MSSRTTRKPRTRKMEQEEEDFGDNQASQSQSVINPPLKKQKTKSGKKAKTVIGNIANIKNVNLDNVDEVSELSQQEASEVENEDKNAKTKKSFTGKRISKYERAQRQADYNHEKDDDEYRDFRVVVPRDPPQAPSGDEMFDAAGK